MAGVMWIPFGGRLEWFSTPGSGTGIVYLLTGGLFGIGWLYDLWMLNGQVHEINRARIADIA